MKHPAVHLRASGRNGTLYTGFTRHLVRRVWQQREHLAPGFTDEHTVILHVNHERHTAMESATAREKPINKWRRAWRLRLIEACNPYWRDLQLEMAIA